MLVRTAAAGLNFIETYQRAGVYPVEYPFVPGTECAGTVEETGPGVEGFAPGDRVATAEAVGAYATIGEMCGVLRGVYGEYKEPLAV